MGQKKIQKYVVMYVYDFLKLHNFIRILAHFACYKNTALFQKTTKVIFFLPIGRRGFDMSRISNIMMIIG